MTWKKKRNRKGKRKGEGKRKKEKRRRKWRKKTHQEFRGSMKISESVKCRSMASAVCC